MIFVWHDICLVGAQNGMNTVLYINDINLYKYHENLLYYEFIVTHCCKLLICMYKYEYFNEIFHFFIKPFLDPSKITEINLILYRIIWLPYICIRSQRKFICCCLGNLQKAKQWRSRCSSQESIWRTEPFLDCGYTTLGPQKIHLTIYRNVVTAPLELRYLQ